METKLELTLKERLSLMEILPIEGSIIEQIITAEIKDKVRPKTADIERCDIQPQGQGIVYDISKDEPIGFIFNGPEMELIKTSCAKVDELKKVTPFNLSIIRKILNK